MLIVENLVQKQTLDCLNIPNHKRISSEKFRHVKAKELIVTDHPVVVSGNATKDIQNIPNWISLWLKEKFLNTENTINKKNNVYVKKINIDSRYVKKVYFDKSFLKTTVENAEYI